MFLFLAIYVLPPLALAIFLHFISDKKIEADDFKFIYHTDQGKLIIENPFRGFGVFGGAGSGKTKSITKPTIENCARLNVCGAIYDYKKFDLTCCALTMYKKYNSSVKLHFVNFFDLKYSERVNPVAPEMLENPAYASQAASTLIRNLVKGSEESKDPFFIDAAESGLAGILWRLKEDFPEQCSLPYAVAISLNKDICKVYDFVSKNKQASLIAAPFLQSAVSEKQMAGVAASMSSGMRKLALPELFYVLSGNDFSLDLNNPQEPKLLCISNYQVLEDVFSPVIALTINMALKQMNQEGKSPSIVMLDEGTTIKIPNFDNIPATARENKIITFFICQDMVQGEGTYGRIGRDKILANLANQMYGLVRDPQTAERYSKMFGKEFKEFSSKSIRQGDLFISSSTRSPREVDIYPPQVFQQLEAGEFYGVFADANHKTFNARYKMYDEIEMPMKILNSVTSSEVQRNFHEILAESDFLVQN
ncbi:MAG: type IV secretory system conjugative DNA transfer family protein [Bacteroidota bacterium]|nr:type IV secretory system conjugative DNA transfer family protein [Bacteroidota bacterium]